MVIKIQLRDPQTGSEKTFEFGESPIRIGRNALNNVVIEDRFVSQWHGMVRFDDRSFSYFDLGSTNGTSLGGKRLAKNTATLLGGVAQLRIARFELAVTACPSPTTKPMNWGELHHPEVAPAAPSQGSDQLARCLRVLEGFSDAFVALKKGYEEFGAEVGVRPLAGSTPLHRARNGREVMAHLLAPTTEVEACLGDLKIVFADMGIHQIALMEGITQGIRSLLESIDPSPHHAQTGAGLFSRSPSKVEWAGLQERLATLIAEDTALHAEIFGAEFARAYASVALGPGERP